MALNVTNYTFDIDMVPKGFPPVVPSSQGDVGRAFVVNLYWNGTSWTPASGTTCKVRGKKPDNTVFNNDATISGSTVTFTTTEQMTIIDGKVECELAFTDGTKKIATANFYLLVEGSAYNPDAPSTSDISGIGEDAIEDGAITIDKLDPAVRRAVYNWAILDNSTNQLTAVQLDNTEYGIRADTVENSAITTAKIADSAVTSAKLNDGAVSTAKLGSRAVTGAKIATNTIVWDNLASGLQNRIHMAEPNSWVVLENNYIKQVYDDIDDETYRLMASKLSTTAQTKQVSTDNVILTKANGSIVSVPWEGFTDAILTKKCSSVGRNITNAWYNGTLKEEIKNGDFSNVNIGDVITGEESGHNYVVVDFDYFRNTGPYGNRFGNIHHIVLMPAKSNNDASESGKINATATTAGGFKASKAFTTDLPAYADGILTDDFGDNLISFPVYVSNAVTNGKASGAEWVYVKAMIPNEVQLAGYTSFGNAYDTGTGVYKFQLFNGWKKYAYFGDMTLCCCDIVNGSQYSVWSMGGYFAPLNANTSSSIRPYFCLGVTE